MCRFLIATVVLFATASAANAQLMYGLVQTAGGANRIISFDYTTPGTVTPGPTVTGLGGGETLIGFDIRPATGGLVGIGTGSVIYNIDPVTGVATAAGPAFTPALAGTSFGVDFNPTVDRIRVVSDTGQNLRLNPITGGVAGVDTPLNPGSPNVRAAAYTNSVPGSTSTTLFDIDTTLDQLFIQNPPNPGTLVLVGNLGVSVDDNAPANFDISGPFNVAAASFSVGGVFGLYNIFLPNGQATFVGNIGGLVAGDTVTGLTFVAVPEPSSMALVGLAAAAGVARLRRRRAAK
jgi:hypothetical protein